MPTDKVVVITTGGTIAMRDDGAGAVPALAGAALLGALPLPAGVQLHVEPFSNVPSSHLSVEQLWELQERATACLAAPDVCGVVVTHGTDTLEETAYLLDCTVLSDKPIVLTGAMRTASDEAYEGRYNLRAALNVALDPQAAGRGTMVVMNDEVHAARFVTKATSHNAGAFASPGWGPMARLYDGQPVWGWQITRDVLPTRRLNPDVHLLSVTSGASDLLLRHLVAQRVAGIVIEGFGGGRVPPTWLPLLQEAVEAGIAVMVASRTAHGFTHDGYGYPGGHRDLADRIGVLFADGLSALKARIRLMCLLGA